MDSLSLPQTPHLPELLGKRKRTDGEGSAMEDEDVDFDHYFATYVPLSNLPTPPAPKLPSFPLTPPLDAEDVQIRDPATYLSNTIPQNASLHRLSPAVIACYLSRCQLPQSTVALAASIIDSLSSFFVRTWRKECANLSLRTADPSSPCSFIHPPRRDARTPKSALIVLAALSIATGFLDDVKSDAKWWASRIARGAVEAREIDTTVRCILKDIDYDLLSFTPDVVEDVRRDIFACTASEAEPASPLFFSPAAPASACAPACETSDHADSNASDQRPPGLHMMPPFFPQPDLKAVFLKEGLPTPELSPASDHDEHAMCSGALL